MTLNEKDMELFGKLAEIANLYHDGHMTIFKFTTNWRIMFGTPHSRSSVNLAHDGKTFAEAAEHAIRVEEDLW